LNINQFYRTFSLMMAGIITLGTAVSVHSRPNILFLFTDDQKPNTIHSLGNDAINTPVLDSMVAEGTVFTNAYINGSNSGAVCLPSRTMVMTGRSLWRQKSADNQLDKILPTAFHNEGYDTYRICKRGNSYSKANAYFNINIEQTHREATGASWYIDGAIKYLQNRMDKNDTDPFFLYLGFANPHDPVNAPQEYLDKYGASSTVNPDAPLDKMPPLPPNYMTAHPFDNGEMNIRDENRVQGVGSNRDERTIRNHIGKYYAKIEYIDSQLKRILNKLVEMGIADSTYIIFSSDHGLAVGEHGLMGKQNLYEHSAGAPLIFMGPGIPKGERRDALVYLYDLFPTFTDMAGFDPPASVEGKSLLPVILGEQKKVRDYLLYAYTGIQRGIRDERYKLIEYFVNGEMTTQLFDLWTDPWEINSLADNVAFADTLLRMRKEIGIWKTEWGDTASFWTAYQELYPTASKFTVVDYEGKGCMNPAYVEYDAYAVYEPPGACKNIKVSIKLYSGKVSKKSVDNPAQTYDALGRNIKNNKFKSRLFVNSPETKK
jgi:choline-sulfatase